MINCLIYTLTGIRCWKPLPEVFRPPIVARGPVDNCARRRANCPEWNVLRKLRETLQEVLKKQLLADHSVTQLRQEHIPIRVTGIKLSELLLNVYTECSCERP